MVEELTENFCGLDKRGCVVLNYSGLKGPAAISVRDFIRSKGASMTVVRNTLFGIAVERLGAPGLKGIVNGPTAVVLGEDPVAAARVAEEAAKSFTALRIAGGYAEGKVLDAQGVERLANLPSRETLLSQLLSCACAPAQRFAFGLKSLQTQLAAMLEELREKKSKEEDSPAGT